MSDPTERELRDVASKAKRRRRLPADARCAACGTADHLSRRPDGSIRCYAHLSSDDARVELDHWMGRVVPSAVIPLDANAHRSVTDLRLAIGFDELPAPNHPLLLLARMLMGMASLLIVVADWLVAYVAAPNTGVVPPPFPIVP